MAERLAGYSQLFLCKKVYPEKQQSLFRFIPGSLLDEVLILPYEK